MSVRLVYQKKSIWRTVLIAIFAVSGLSGLLVGCGTKTDNADQDLPAPETIATTIPKTDGITVSQKKIPASIRFSKIGSDDGLTQSTTYAITQDSLGFMWFGTEDGLNRYDGYEFITFRPISEDSHSLSDRWITTLLAEEDGNLWIGTRQGGLNFYNSTTGLFDRYRVDEKDSTSLSGDHVTVLFIDHLGRLWVGTTSGLNLMVKETANFQHYYFDDPNTQGSDQLTITAINEDEYGNLWVGTGTSGMFRLNPSSGVFEQFEYNPLDLNSISSNTIRRILPAGQNQFWVATDNGLNLFSPSDKSFFRYQHSDEDTDSLADNRIRTMIVDRSGFLWLGTSTGLECFDIDTSKFYHYRHDPMDLKSLGDGAVLSIFESTDNVLWVSTYGGYISKYSRGMDRFTFYHYSSQDPTTIDGNGIFKLFVDNQQFVWVATIDGGLNRLNPTTGKFISYRHDPEDENSLASDEVWAVYKDSEGILWVGTNAGLDRLDPGSQDFSHYPNNYSSGNDSVHGMVYDIVEDRSGDLWFGTTNGLDRYDRQKDIFIHYIYDANNPNGISDSIITKVYVDNTGTLWIGTFSRGLNRYDPVNNEFIQYRHNPDDSNSLNNDSILSVFQDHLNRIWVGTAGGGLDLLNPETNVFTHFTEEDGLPNNVIYGILEDENGRLWLSTNNGISCFDPEKASFINYNEADGIQGNEFDMNAYAKDDLGTMYFGGVNGLTGFHPDGITPSVFIPPVRLLTLTQNGKSLSSEADPNQLQEITITWPNNSFEFSFAALSYADPKMNQYAYRLLNFDQRWIDATSWREGRYTNLPGGTYTLQIKGSNEDGVWNETGHSLIVRVIPAFWQTLWFQIGTVVILFGSILVFYRVRSATVKANTEKLEQQVRERTKEIERLFEKTKELAVVEERNRLARELHDSAKQKAFAALAQLGTANGVLPANPQSAKAHLQEAENLVYEVIEELTFLIQEMYPLALKEKGLATSLRDYVFDWEARTDIQVQVEIEHEKHLPLEVEQAIYRAIQEALSNIARHSHASSVKISLSYSKVEILATICDNGIGFDPLTRQNGMGLRTIRERMETLGGSLKIESRANQGTCLTLTCPAQPHQMQKGEDNDKSHLNHSGG